MRFLYLVFLGLPFAMAARTDYEPCKACIYKATTAKLSGIGVRLYTGVQKIEPHVYVRDHHWHSSFNDLDTYTEVVVGDAVNLLDKMDLNKPSVVYIFGMLGTPNWKSSQVIIEAYIKRQDHNVVVLNWKEIAGNEYIYIARSVSGVGYTLAKVLDEWVAAGLNSTSIHLVGHSMGGQIAGYAGRYVNFTLPRIVALDPAGPMFYAVVECLNRGDAEFVQVIHTDDGHFGLRHEVGHVEFYPNSGIHLQPGCLTGNGCSHLRACYYYAESLRNEDAFIGRACDDSSSFKIGSCNSNGLSVMGFATPSTTRGKYYLETAAASPYGLGMKGTIYDDSTNVIISTFENFLSTALASW